MLDIKFIRENLDLVKLAAEKKRSNVDLDALIKLDDTRRAQMSALEEKKRSRIKSQKTLLQLMMHNELS